MLEVTLPYLSPSPGTKDKAVSFESDINNGWLFLFCFLGFRDLSRGRSVWCKWYTGDRQSWVEVWFQPFIDHSNYCALDRKMYFEGSAALITKCLRQDNILDGKTRKRSLLFFKERNDKWEMRPWLTNKMFAPGWASTICLFDLLCVPGHLNQSQY